MPIIAYNNERLLYNPSVLDESEKTKFILREVSESTFRILQNLPSNVFRLETNVRDLVERFIQGEPVEEAA